MSSKLNVIPLEKPKKKRKITAIFAKIKIENKVHRVKIKTRELKSGDFSIFLEVFVNQKKQHPSP